MSEKLCDWNGFSNLYSDGVAAAENADVCVLCLGLDRSAEGEEMQNADSTYLDHGDRKRLTLPLPQQKLAEMVCDVCEKVIVILFGGSSIDIGEKVRRHAKAILYGWYPGALGGLAIAKILAGNANPGGRLPITIYRADTVLPDFTDYSMQGRTYRYLQTAPLYPFGYGLSYTDFRYDSAKITHADEQKLTVSLQICNTGAYDGSEKIQIYAVFSDSRTRTPHAQLCAVQAVELKAGERKQVSLEIDRFWLQAVLPDGTRVSPDGKTTLHIGGCYGGFAEIPPADCVTFSSPSASL